MIGLDLYAQLLDEAVRTLRGQPAKTMSAGSEYSGQCADPRDLCRSTQITMLYKRLANTPDEERVLGIAEDGDALEHHPAHWKISSERCESERLLARCLLKLVSLT